MKRAAVKSRKNLFGWLKPKVYSASTKQTYGSHAEATKDRLRRQKEAKEDKREARRDLVARRKEKLEDMRYEKERKKLEREIAAADRKIEAAERKIEAAEKKVDKGGMAEAQFEAMKRRMESEIQKQEEHKRAAAAKNPHTTPAQKAAMRWRQIVQTLEAEISNLEQRYRKEGTRTLSAQLSKKFKSLDAAKKKYAKAYDIAEREGGLGPYPPQGKRGVVLKSSQYKSKYNPAVTAAQYRLARAVLSGTARSKMPRKVAQEIVDRTPKRLASALMMGTAGNPSNGGMNATEKRHDAEARKLIAKRFAEGEDAEKVGRRVWRSFGYLNEVKNGVLIVNLNAGVERFPQPKANPGGSGRKSAKRTKKPATRSNRKVKRNCKKGKRNPAADAQSLSQKFHGRPSTSVKVVEEKLHVHKHLTELGDLVRLVIDTPTGIVAVLNFNTSDSRKIVKLASSERDPKTGQVVGKQLYLRGGDQEVNLAGLKMDSSLWIRDLMELGRLHEFKRGDPKLIVNGEQVKGSITYRTRKGMDDFKLVDYWHKAGEETASKAGPAARSLVLYDYPNKRIQFAGGQYKVEGPGIIN